MWLILSIFLIPITIIAFVLVVRKMATDRKRSISWNNLHERGKLMASQLEMMREKAEQNKVEPEAKQSAQNMAEPPEKPLSFWPRRTRNMRNYGISSPAAAHSNQESIL